MIKLNNKNITYVALADSNNSVKGVKELWYADSNNSVKLVYRRKDALIEDEDYEKYHWLVSTGAEWIDTAVILDTNMGIYTIFAPLETDVFEHGIFGASSEPNDHNVLQIQRTDVGLYIPSGIRVAYANVILNAVQDWSINLANDAKVYLNGAYVADTCPSSSSTIPYPIAIFSRNRDGQVSQSNCSIIKINKFTIVKNSIPIITLIPCKLLKPVPKWLDANGIRRQVGECGMIDLVSGKFYGNVNSNGTFTVENYYERKEWLVGDGSAYIDTLHLANEGLLWETHVSNLSFKKYFIWNRVVGLENPSISLYHSMVTEGLIRVQNNYTDSIVLQNQTDYDYTVTTNSNGAVINGVQYIGQSVSENISNKSIKLFHCDVDASGIQYVIDHSGNSQDVKCSYFRFIDANGKTIQNLIPCTLTMDLPASMDANGIARTKGTSGMWDLVSDRFYGNVASSGTFSVEDDN